MPPTIDDVAPLANNALLKSIQKGAKLKKAITNDKSAPVIDSKGSASTPGGGDKQPSIDTVKQKLGGMFGGMPALGSIQLKPVNRGSTGREEPRPAIANPPPPTKPLLRSNPPTLPVTRPVQTQEAPVVRPPLRAVTTGSPESVTKKPPIPATRPKPSRSVISERIDSKTTEDGWTFELQLPGPKKATGRTFSYSSKHVASSSPDKTALKERKKEIEKLREEMKRAASKEDFALAQELKYRITELEGAQ